MNYPLRIIIISPNTNGLSKLLQIWSKRISHNKIVELEHLKIDFLNKAIWGFIKMINLHDGLQLK